MKCKFCDGTGKVNGLYFDTTKSCKYCNGTGEVEMTEQEWLQTATAEQLAEVFMRFMFDAKFKRKFVYGNFCNEFAKWLKQPHEDYWNKKRKEPITNDEWRKTCSTEEFAKLLQDAMWYGEQCATEGVLCENCKCPWCEGISNWLKQPHIVKG